MTLDSFYENISEAWQVEPGVTDRLLTASLLKTVKTQKNEWAFAGIASDETPDVEEDTILKKALDLSYAQKRGYVNWDHSRNPEDQIGFLSRVELIEPNDIPTLSKSLGVDLPKTVSVYVEGELYPHVERAKATQLLLKSVPEGNKVGPGLSLDGALARDKESKEIVKAFVRGVAITTVPAHTNTLARMKKSLRDYSLGLRGESSTMDAKAFVQSIIQEELQKAAEATKMNFDTATLWVLKKNPAWTYEQASKIVQSTFEKKK